MGFTVSHNWKVKCFWEVTCPRTLPRNGYHSCIVLKLWAMACFASKKSAKMLRRRHHETTHFNTALTALFAQNTKPSQSGVLHSYCNSWFPNGFCPPTNLVDVDIFPSICHFTAIFVEVSKILDVMSSSISYSCYGVLRGVAGIFAVVGQVFGKAVVTDRVGVDLGVHVSKVGLSGPVIIYVYQHIPSLKLGFLRDLWDSLGFSKRFMGFTWD